MSSNFIGHNIFSARIHKSLYNTLGVYRYNNAITLVIIHRVKNLLSSVQDFSFILPGLPTQPPIRFSDKRKPT